MISDTAIWAAMAIRSFGRPISTAWPPRALRFTDFYVAQAVCSASRAALLTGCYPNRIGILGALGPESKIGIGDQETNIAQLLNLAAMRLRSTANGISAITRNSCQLATDLMSISACHTPTTCGRSTRRPSFPTCRCSLGEKIVETNPDMNGLTADTPAGRRFHSQEQGPAIFPVCAAHDAARAARCGDQFRGKSKARTLRRRH